MKFAQRFSKKITTGARIEVESMNNKLAVASATSAIVTALLMKDESFLPVLQHVFYYGDDTDGVGAMLGSLLGAYAGCTNNLLNKYEPFQAAFSKILCSDRLMTAFREFISMASDPDYKAEFDYIELEREVTHALLAFPNGERNEPYNSAAPLISIRDLTKDLNVVKREVRSAVERGLRKYATAEGRQSLEQLFTQIYCQIFLAADISEMAVVLSSEQRKKIFVEVWNRLILAPY